MPSATSVFAIRELLVEICEYLDIIALVRTSQACRTLTEVSRSVARKRVDAYLSQYVENPSAFRTMLEETASIVVGDIPFAVIAEKRNTRPLKNPVLTIVAPGGGEGDAVRRFIFENGYKRLVQRGEQEDDVRDILQDIEGQSYTLVENG